MNNIKLYINNLNNSVNDTRIKELERISEQYFTFTEDAHNSIFYKNLANNLFYKDEKNYLLKEIWFTKQDFIGNLKRINNYFNQLNINNSIIFLCINEQTTNKYKFSDIKFVFNNLYRTMIFGLRYSLNNIDEHFNISYDNNYTIFNIQKENKFISEFDNNSELEFNSNEKDNYSRIEYETIKNSNNYLKVFYKRDISFHIPKVFISIFFFHPFFRPNYQNFQEKLNSKNDKLYFEYLLYFNYIKRRIQEELADAFRAGGNYCQVDQNKEYIFLILFIYSDKAQEVMKIINNIISNQTNLESELNNRFELYRDSVLQTFLSYRISPDLTKLVLAFHEALTKDEKDNLPPIYDYNNFPIESFSNITFTDLDIDEITNTFYSIKYIYLLGDINETVSENIYKIFNSTNHFKSSLDIANFSATNIDESNFVDWSFKKNLITKSFNFSCHNCNYISHLINVTEYSLQTSCLIDMLRRILKEDENFKQLDIEIIDLKLRDIYLGFVFTYKEKEIENEKLIEKIFELLEKNEKMTKKVDVIGDKFYYLFEGYKRTKNIRYYDIIETGQQASLQHVDGTYLKNNSIDDFEIGDYKEFIKIIKLILPKNISYIRINSTKNS